MSGQSGSATTVDARFVPGLAGLLKKAEEKKRLEEETLAAEEAQVEREALDKEIAAGAETARQKDLRRVKGRASTLLTSGGAGGLLPGGLKTARKTLLGV